MPATVTSKATHPLRIGVGNAITSQCYNLAGESQVPGAMNRQARIHPAEPESSDHLRPLIPRRPNFCLLPAVVKSAPYPRLVGWFTSDPHLTG
jgi:hypothetical protein